MIFKGIDGVPDFDVCEFSRKISKYCLCIPVLNENGRIHAELERAKREQIDKFIDIVICDGGTTDGSLDDQKLSGLNINSVLRIKSEGKLSGQLRMGFWWALQRGYEGVVTVDGNNKDSIESVLLFVQKLEEGFDFIQGSRFIKGGKERNTPVMRYLAIRLIHAPLISLAAGYNFTDTTNGFRGHSRNYLEHPQVKPFRDIFIDYDLLPYLSIKASQLGLKVCEVPVERIYPDNGEVPTKITNISSYWKLLVNLRKIIKGYYDC